MGGGQLMCEQPQSEHDEIYNALDATRSQVEAPEGQLASEQPQSEIGKLRQPLCSLISQLNIETLMLDPIGSQVKAFACGQIQSLPLQRKHVESD
ncbi:hypothetical protein N9L68_02290 [bacterium]|nr:hypothetical protein [bacterium]